MNDFNILKKKEYKNCIITYLKITKYGKSQLPYINKRTFKQNKRQIFSTLWNSKDDIVKFVTIKPSPQFRVSKYSEQNRMVINLMKKLKMPKYAFVNELNDKNPDSPVFGTYHTHALVSEYRPKYQWEETFGKGFVSVDEVHNIGKQINYVLKYVLKSTLPKGARVICVGYDQVKTSRVSHITEKVISFEIQEHRQTFIANKGDAPI